jgi:hypothetical protein
LQYFLPKACRRYQRQPWGSAGVEICYASQIFFSTAHREGMVLKKSTKMQKIFCDVFSPNLSEKNTTCGVDL